MWFEVIIALIVLLFIYNTGIENMTGRDVLKILVLILVPVLVYNFIVDSQKN